MVRDNTLQTPEFYKTEQERGGGEPMSDLTIRELCRLAFAGASKRGFRDGADVSAFGLHCALIHSEVSEALEEWRKPGGPLNEDRIAEDGKPEGLPSELADIVIRVCDNAEALGIDLDAAIRRKMAYNETRPYRHGGKRA